MKVTSPIFLQQASNVTPFAGVKMLFNIADPEIDSITGTNIVVTSIKNGVKTTQTYTSLDSAEVSISADKGTWISITGSVTELQHSDSNIIKMVVKNTTALTSLNCNNCYSLTSLDLSNNTALTDLSCDGCYLLTSLDLSNNTALTDLSCYECYSLTSLDLSNNTALTDLTVGYCKSLTSLDLSNNTALTSLNITYTSIISIDLSNNTALTNLECDGCYLLTSLDLSNNTALTDLSCSHCYSLSLLDLSNNTALEYLACNSCVIVDSIKYGAINSSVSTKIAELITANEALDGTVYTNSTGTYYSTIADAATTAGWTIAQL